MKKTLTTHHGIGSFSIPVAIVGKHAILDNRSVFDAALTEAWQGHLKEHSNYRELIKAAPFEFELSSTGPYGEEGVYIVVTTTIEVSE